MGIVDRTKAYKFGETEEFLTFWNGKITISLLSLTRKLVASATPSPCLFRQRQFCCGNLEEAPMDHRKISRLPWLHAWGNVFIVFSSMLCMSEFETLCLNYRELAKHREACFFNRMILQWALLLHEPFEVELQLVRYSMMKSLVNLILTRGSS